MHNFSYIPSIHQVEFSGVYTGGYLGRKGFKEFFDVNDSSYIADLTYEGSFNISFSYNEPDYNNLETVSKMFRIYVPPGCIKCSINLITWEGSKEYGRVSWNDDPNITEYDETKIYKTTGYNIQEIIDGKYQCFYKDIYPGIMKPVNSDYFTEISEGGWLCIKSSTDVKQINILYSINYKDFKIWYNENIWDSNGDPIIESTPNETASLLVVTPETINISKNPGSFNITIASDTSWNITSDFWWLTTDFSTSGTGKEIKGFSCAENSEKAARTGKIKIKTSTETKYITVNQSLSDASLSLSAETISLKKESGTQTLSITCNNNWGAYTDSTWLIITSEVSGFGNGTLTFAHSQNSGTSRTNFIKVFTGTQTKNINITQLGTSTSNLSVFPENVSINNESGTFVLNVVSTAKWTASIESSWLSIISGLTGSGSGSIYCSNLQNDTSQNRISIIKVISGTEQKTINVTQSSTISSNLSVYPETVSLSKNSGNFSISVTSNSNWIASSNSSWVTIVSGSSGNNNGTINCSNLECGTEERKATIKVSTSSETIFVNITQSTTTTLFVIPEEISVSKDPGTFTASISSNAKWTVTTDSTWLTLNFSNSGVGSDKKSISFIEHTGTNSRIGNVSVKTTNETKNIKVIQTTSTTSLSVSAESFNIPKTSGNQTFSITCNNNWGVYTDSSWLKISSENSGFGNGNVTFTYPQNIDTYRTNTIKVFTSNQVKTITVIQTGTKESSLSVFPETLSLTKETGGFVLNVISNTEWSVRTASLWISIIKGNSGTKDGTIYCSYLENIETSNRSGNVSVTTGEETKSINITQLYTSAINLSANPETFSVAKDSGKFNSEISASEEWKAVCDCTWLTITSASSGTKSGTLTCTYSKNSDTSTRTGNITITSLTEIVVIKVTQANSSVITTDLKDFDLIVKTKKEFDEEYGNSYTTKVFGKLVLDGGNNTIQSGVVSFKDLFGSEKSFGYIQYVSGMSTKDLTEKYPYEVQKVLQKGYYNIGKVGSGTITTTDTNTLTTILSKTKLDKTAGTFTISVSNTGKGTMPWTAKIDGDSSWITITSGASGSNTGIISCSYTANSGSAAKTGKVIVTATGASGSPKTISISQDKVSTTTGTQFYSGYASYHQIERKINYCSDKVTDDPQGTIICNKSNQNKYYTMMKGFKSLYNINDPKIYCYGQSSCTIKDSDTLVLATSLNNVQLSSNFRVYVPKGAIHAEMSIYGIQQNGAIGTLSRFGVPPTKEEIDSLPKVYDDIPHNIVGFTIPEYSEKAHFVKNRDGIIQVTKIQDFDMLSEGSWLYVSIMSYDGSSSDTYKYSTSFKVGEYKSWYNSAVWDKVGDPPEIVASTTSTTTSYKIDYTYSSVYQIPLEVLYCNDIATGGELDKYPCTGGKYLHSVTYTGFKNQWNPNDPRRR